MTPARSVWLVNAVTAGLEIAFFLGLLVAGLCLIPLPRCTP